MTLFALRCGACRTRTATQGSATPNSRSVSTCSSWSPRSPSPLVVGCCVCRSVSMRPRCERDRVLCIAQRVVVVCQRCLFAFARGLCVRVCFAQRCASRRCAATPRVRTLRPRPGRGRLPSVLCLGPLARLGRCASLVAHAHASFSPVKARANRRRRLRARGMTRSNAA